jgi:hypothetical protein
VEIFPEGEFKQMRGYGTIARRLGHRYERVDISSNLTLSHGTQVPTKMLLGAVTKVLDEVLQTGGSCFLPDVLIEPFL